MAATANKRRYIPPRKAEQPVQLLEFDVPTDVAATFCSAWRQWRRAVEYNDDDRGWRDPCRGLSEAFDRELARSVRFVHVSGPALGFHHACRWLVARAWDNKLPRAVRDQLATLGGQFTQVLFRTLPMYDDEPHEQDA